MKKLMSVSGLILIITAIIILFTSGCKDATYAQFKSLGCKHMVTLYANDGKIIKQWESTGNVSNQAQSDGWYFEDSKTHKLIEVTGTLVIEQE